MKTEFACVAEAVAYYFHLGYADVDTTGDDRIMTNGTERIRIVHRDLLDVVVETM
jgi:hypothetical protein